MASKKSPVATKHKRKTETERVMTEVKREPIAEHKWYICVRSCCHVSEADIGWVYHSEVQKRNKRGKCKERCYDFDL